MLIPQPSVRVSREALGATWNWPVSPVNFDSITVAAADLVGARAARFAATS